MLLFFMVDMDMVMLLDTPDLDMLQVPPTDTPPMLPLPTDTLPLDTDADTMERDLLKLKLNQRPMLLFFMVDTDMVMLLDTPGMDMLPDLLLDTPPMLPLPTDTPPLDTDAGSMERDLLKPSQKLKLMLLIFMVDMDMVMVLDTPDLDMLLTLTDTLLIPLPIPLLASLTTVK